MDSYEIIIQKYKEIYVTKYSYINNYERAIYKNILIFEFCFCEILKFLSEIQNNPVK